MEDSNPQAIEHSKEIELSGPSGHPPQVIEPSNTQEIELSGPLGALLKQLSTPVLRRSSCLALRGPSSRGTSSHGPPLTWALLMGPSSGQRELQ
ncbi:hypothetical protein NL676_039827 [Syzygium grande]|nr:hypothetical protein NL676_039827 [Syzygium grande]